MAEEVKCQVRILEWSEGKWKSVYCQTKHIDSKTMVYIVERYAGKLFDKEVRKKKALIGRLDKSLVPESKE